MQTPIADFVKEYAKKNGCRFHMPGHKGQAFLGCESLDITEIAGADALYEAEGIIAESEKNAAKLFGTARTLFGTEGSSQCIRAMMQLVVGYQRSAGMLAAGSHGVVAKTGNVEQLKTQTMRPYVIAARNVHKAFLYAAALVDFDVVWLYPKEMHSLCSCQITATEVEAELQRQLAERGGVKPAAVYVTSPDYLGGQLDIAALAEVCHRYETLLAVDNAHGAYLHFLKEAKHPMDLGADICCDSAHKTLPVLTGGAYLQINKNAPEYFVKNAKQAMVLFGSTSPSYLIMQSLDLCNAYLADGYQEKLAETANRLEKLRETLRATGWQIEETDPLKLTLRMTGTTLAEKLSVASEGMAGIVLADALRERGIECEYADNEYLVLMATPENTEEDFVQLETALLEIAGEQFGQNSRIAAEETLLTDDVKMDVAAGEKKPTWHNQQLAWCQQPVKCRQRMTIREALFAEQELILAKDALGRICGAPTVGCPPAIPIVVSGEEINEAAIVLFEQYGVEKVAVVASPVV